MGIKPPPLSSSISHSPSALLCFVCFFALCICYFPHIGFFVVLLHYLTLKVSSCIAVL